MAGKLKKVSYGTINDSNSLDFKTFFENSEVDEKKYIKFTYNKTTGENRFEYKIDKELYISIIKNIQHRGVFDVEANPVNNKVFPRRSIGYNNASGQPTLAPIFEHWVKHVANEIKKYEALAKKKEVETWKEVKKNIKEYDSTHESLYASLGKFVVDFESMLANARGTIIVLSKMDGSSYWSGFYSDILMSDSTSGNISKYYKASIKMHHHLKQFKEELKQTVKIIPKEQVDFVLKLADLLSNCIYEAGLLRNDVVHATWSISIQNINFAKFKAISEGDDENIKYSLRGVRHNISSQYEPKLMDFKEIDFVQYGDYFNYFTFCIQKLSQFIVGGFFISEAEKDFNEFKQSIDMDKLKEYRSKLTVSSNEKKMKK